jgi:hypothetical protein
MKHRLHQCNDERCYPCENGLSVCEVCGGAEGMLPTECPGQKMTEAVMQAVMDDRVDFRGGLWIESPDPIDAMCETAWQDALRKPAEGWRKGVDNVL